MKTAMQSDVRFMKTALALGAQGKGLVHPNPLVGCVIVKDGKVVGKGYHEYFGGPHAEVVALRQAGKLARGATLYVTLEPCSHVGKTPPCVDAIIRAKIRRVVIAARDPNPVVRGKGLRKLLRHSVKVTEGLLSVKAQKLNAGYNRRVRKRRESVIVKFAMSTDGKIATRTGDSKWISSEPSRRLVHQLRSTVDAVVVGSRTAIVDNPALSSHGRGPNPVRVVIDPNLRIPLGRKVFDSSAATIVMHASRKSNTKLGQLRKRHVMTVRLSRRRKEIPFSKIIHTLRKFGLGSILIEGGGETIASALEMGVVTDVYAFIAPRIIGGASAVTPVAGTGVARVGDALELSRIRVKKVGTDFLLTAKVSNGSSSERR